MASVSTEANAKKKAQKELCKALTPKFRVSYPHVFKPNSAKPGDKAKYSVTMLFSKDTDMTKIKEIIKQAKITTFGDKKNWPEELASPVIDGDLPKFKDKEGYKGHWVIKASCSEDSRPEVLDRDMEPITKPADFYPGCYARAYVYATTWEYMGKQGVMFILDHIQKVADGKSFGGKKPASAVFSPIESDDTDFEGDDSDSDFM